MQSDWPAPPGPEACVVSTFPAAGMAARSPTTDAMSSTRIRRFMQTYPPLSCCPFRNLGRPDLDRMRSAANCQDKPRPPVGVPSRTVIRDRSADRTVEAAQGVTHIGQCSDTRFLFRSIVVRETRWAAPYGPCAAQGGNSGDSTSVY